MQYPDLPDPLVVIAGPTAIGKSALAIELAQKVRGEIVSADSRLFYRGMDIGTAKPSQEEQKLVPHHLIDVADPDQAWSLVLFQEEAQKAIFAIHARKKLPILVGGTGQYIQAVLEGWHAPEFQPDFYLRRALESWGQTIGPRKLHARLERIDPEAASHIEPGNLRRTVRALEVIFKSGRRFSEQKQKGKIQYSVCMIGLTRPREELYAQIDARVDHMIAFGLLNEVKSLLAKGYPPNLSPFSAIGYREMIAVIRGEMSIEEAAAQMKRLTRQFVRRQANWLKRSNKWIHWINPEWPNEAALNIIQTESCWVPKGSEF